MASHPIPNFRELEKFNSLSTKKERKSLFSNFGPPPKAPVRSCPVPRIYSVLKEDAPRPISFREDSDISFITGSPIYTSRKGTYFEQCYKIDKILGKGSFGEVFKVVSKENGLEYACKKNILQYRGIVDRTRRIQEVKKHEQMEPHVNIVKFFRAWEEKNHLYMLTEVCKSTLADILVDNHEFPEHQLWAYLVDILQGLEHLHKHKFIHMDVKPDNIFIGMDDHCKLGDFGLSIDFSNGYPTEAVDGDPKYLAPECLQLVYSPAADVFSLGIVMLEIATDLYLPHAGPKWHELRTGIIPSMENRGLSIEFETIVKRLLEPDHTKRITSSEAVNYKPVSKVIIKNNFYGFFKNKIRSINWFFGTMFYLPIMFFSYFASVLKRRLFGFKSPLTIKKKVTPDGSHDNIDVDIDVDIISKIPSNLFPIVNKLKNVQPVYSTPKSHSKRKIFRRDQLQHSKCDEDELDRIKYSFNESSFSNLELSRELSIQSPAASRLGVSLSESRLGMSPSESQHGVPYMSEPRLGIPAMSESPYVVDPTASDSRVCGLDITARNLLDVFNTAGSSSEDES